MHRWLPLASSFETTWQPAKYHPNFLKSWRWMMSFCGQGCPDFPAGVQIRFSQGFVPRCFSPDKIEFLLVLKLQCMHLSTFGWDWQLEKQREYLITCAFQRAFNNQIAGSLWPCPSPAQPTCPPPRRGKCGEPNILQYRIFSWVKQRDNLQDKI